ncbi:hypothetical protein LDO26_03445 [Luteimonas sp. BDR2-5]|uniref:hypothetical protein n=1 Tax=Proluteimonas luteida TaxID=2878685 RepID=UPI001E4C2D2D|nr:hypothetical protein [Luteimonas sp. BDR2-5]MCD9027269.1 hypothetical protein [Luteimonas sp. BDR2-5]
MDFVGTVFIEGFLADTGDAGGVEDNGSGAMGGRDDSVVRREQNSPDAMARLAAGPQKTGRGGIRGLRAPLACDDGNGEGRMQSIAIAATAVHRAAPASCAGAFRLPRVPPVGLWQNPHPGRSG